MTTTADQPAETAAAVPEEREHTVRLLFRLNANNPVDAVQRFIDQVVNHGLRDWTYYVEDREADERFYVKGYGEVERVVDLPDDDEDDDDEGT